MIKLVRDENEYILKTLQGFQTLEGFVLVRKQKSPSGSNRHFNSA
jgi:hypothetical protein